jgi:ABC-type tungstate transport system substrate-binding protein
MSGTKLSHHAAVHLKTALEQGPLGEFDVKTPHPQMVLGHPLALIPMQVAHLLALVQVESHPPLPFLRCKVVHENTSLSSILTPTLL